MTFDLLCALAVETGQRVDDLLGWDTWQVEALLAAHNDRVERMKHG